VQSGAAQAVGAQGVCADPDLTGAAMLEDLSLKYDIDISILEGLVADGYSPGGLRFALQLAEASGSTLDEVLALSGGSETPEWGTVASALGIQPGSEAFHDLKTQAGDNGRGEAGGQAGGEAGGGRRGK